MIESILRYLSNDSTLLYRWQELIGSLLGVFGAIFTVFLGLILNHVYQRHKEFRESLRNTEIVLALALNEIFDTEKHLQDFLERLDQAVMQPLQQLKNPNVYFLNKTNFPHLEIHFDQSLIKARFTSYYIHNKVLILHKNIEGSNRMFREMKVEYEKIMENARFLMTQGATPTNQQREYLSHHQSYVAFVSDVIDQLQLAKKAFAQAKIYNLKLLQKERYRVWRLEGISFKFFWSKKHMKDYKGSLECVDRVEKDIEGEVQKSLRDAEQRRDGETEEKYYGLQIYFKRAQKILSGWLIKL